MKPRGLLLECLMVFVLAPATLGAQPDCQKVFENFITVRLVTGIHIKSAGHTIIYNFGVEGITGGEHSAVVYVDGQPQGVLDGTTVDKEIASRCGPGSRRKGTSSSSART